MFIPTPLSLVSWICTVKGWVFLPSLLMCAEYFAVAWVLREVVWDFVAYAFQTFITYNAFKGVLNEWIPVIKQWFYVTLAYSIIGFCGAVGAITSFLPVLWVYLIYLLVTWGINAWQMWVRIQAILALEGTFKTACNTVGAFMDLGNCDDFFSKIKRWTYEGASVVLLLQATTLICTGILIRREYLKTGFLFTSMFSSAEEIERRKQKMADRKAGKKERKAAKHRHALGKESAGLHEERVARRRERLVQAAGNGEGEAIPLRRMGAAPREVDSSQDSEDDVGDAFDLPRMGRRPPLASEEEEGYAPPEGRRRRGAGRSSARSVVIAESPPGHDSEEELKGGASWDTKRREAEESASSAEPSRRRRRRNRSSTRSVSGIV